MYSYSFPISSYVDMTRRLSVTGVACKAVHEKVKAIWKSLEVISLSRCLCSVKYSGSSPLPPCYQYITHGL